MTTPILYGNKFDWYYNVATNPGNVWYSGSNAYVATSDVTYAAWVTAGGVPSEIATEAILWQTLANGASTLTNTGQTFFPGAKIRAFATSATALSALTAGAAFQGLTLAAGDLIGRGGEVDTTTNGIFKVVAGGGNAVRDFSIFGSYLDIISVSMDSVTYVADGTYGGYEVKWGWTGAPGAIGTGNIAAYLRAANFEPGGSSSGLGLASLGLTGKLISGQFLALTGDVTNTAGSVSTTIANNAVSNAKAAQMAANTVKGNNTGSTANAIDLTVAQVMALIKNSVLSFPATVNFNVGTTDTAVVLTLPTGITRWTLTAVFVTGASASLTTATLGVFTSTGGGGSTICADQAITVNTASENTNNNSMALTATNMNTETYTATTVYARVGTPQGSAATGTVTVSIRPQS